MTEKLYKVLAAGGKSCNGGEFTYSLPTKNEDGTWTPGEWTPKIEGPLELCENGYHLCRRADLVYWLGEEIYEVEAEYIGEADRVEDNEGEDTKIAVRRCRLLRRVEAWTPSTARLFAVWCAREALKLIDHPDPRSVNAVNVAEKYANGEANETELTAARDAAWDAARAVARDAARDAAWDAARDAAWNTARAAARDAAWDAARAVAWNAAWNTARAAARDAARDAAWDAARAAQTNKLFEMLGEG